MNFIKVADIQQFHTRNKEIFNLEVRNIYCTQWWPGRCGNVNVNWMG